MYSYILPLKTLFEQNADPAQAAPAENLTAQPHVRPVREEKEEKFS